MNPHSLYSDEDDKKHVLNRLQNLRDGAKLLNKEKYSPVLAALNTEKYNLKKEDFGQY